MISLDESLSIKQVRWASRADVSVFRVAALSVIDRLYLDLFTAFSGEMYRCVFHAFDKPLEVFINQSLHEFSIKPTFDC